MAVTIAHISDLHLLKLSGAGVLSFFNKRMVGGVNLLLNRAHHHRVDVVEQALRQLVEIAPDHLVVTGDVSNLSLDAEFALGVELLGAFGDASRVSVVPGNHDNYTYEAARQGRFDRHFEPWLRSAVQCSSNETLYPYVKLLDGVAIIGLSSSVPTPPPLATGRVSDRQLEGLIELLRHREVRSRFKLVLVHHPLGLRRATLLRRLRRLSNAGALRRILMDEGADLLLHGHNHRSTFHRLEREGGSPLFVCEAGSTSYAGQGKPGHSGRFNLYTIDEGQLTQVRCFSYSRQSDRFELWQTHTIADRALDRSTSHGAAKE